MSENKIRLIDLTSNPSPSRAFAGPASAGIEYEVNSGLVLNPDNKNLHIIPNPRLYTQVFDDFLGDVIADQWNVQVGNDSLPPSAAIVVGLNGFVRLTTGNDAGASHATNGVQLEGQLNWQADQGNLVFEVKLKSNAVTALALFVGFTDQVAALEFPATLTTTTFTTNAADAVGFLFDTNATTDTIRLVGVKATVDAVHQDTGYALVADVYTTLRVEVDELGNATFFRNGVKVGTQMVNAVSPDVPLVPVIATFSETTTSRLVDVDYVIVGQSR